MSSLSLRVGAAMFALSLAPMAAQASLPVVDGTTSVKLTAAPVLAGAGLTVTPLGSATASPGSDGLPLVYFPITGGMFDTGTFAGMIEHDGSGLELSSGGTSVALTNFVIDTVALSLTGDVAVNGSGIGAVPLFDIGLSGSPFLPFQLSLSSAAAGALTAVFGLPDLTGVEIGLANTVPVTVVPEPATVASMLAGHGLIGGLMARRRRVAAEA